MKSTPEQTKKTRDNCSRVLIHKLMKSTGCVMCGFNEHYACLDFHHVNKDGRGKSPSTLFVAGKMDEYLEEVGKCILVCKNCHYLIEHADKDISNYKVVNIEEYRDRIDAIKQDCKDRQKNLVQTKIAKNT